MRPLPPLLFLAALVPLLLGADAAAEAVSPALVASPDPLTGAVGQALSSPTGITWPVALVLAAWVVVRDVRRSVEQVSHALRDWRPPTITIRLDRTCEWEESPTGHHAIRRPTPVPPPPA